MPRDPDRPDVPEDGDDVEEPFDADADASEADVLDQHREGAPTGATDEAKEIPRDAAEADALDQARSVPVVDEEREG